MNVYECHCFCFQWHRPTALTATCIAAPEPGLVIVRTAALVGPAALPVCRYCFEAVHSPQPGTPPRG